MKGCALSLLVSLLGYVAIVVGIVAGLGHFYGMSPRDAAIVALGVGLLVWIAANLVKSAVTAWRERGAIVASLAGTTPVDGRQTVLTGFIEPTGQVLRAPLSGRECVAYTFEAFEYRRSGSRSTKVPFCDGLAVTPSLIVTRTGSYGLLAVPELDCAEVVLDHDAARARVGDLLRRIPLTPPAVPFRRSPIEQQWNDDDGAFERLSRHVPEDQNLANCRMSERHIERGARVSVFGTYSAARRAIVANTQDWSKITRVMKGDPDGVAKQLRASVVRRSIGAVIFGGAAAGVIYAFVNGAFG